jgi:acetoin utilization protein AcuB
LGFDSAQKEAAMTKVKQWMTMNPITMEEDASVIEAIHIMKEKNVRRIPVTKNGRFVGLVTERMIKEYTPQQGNRP